MRDLLFEKNHYKVERIITDYLKQVPDKHKPLALKNMESYYEGQRYNPFPIFGDKEGKKVLEEINRVIETNRNSLQQLPISPPHSYFKLSSRVSKIDLIRLLNAMYALRFCEKSDGSIPSKKEFMHTMGEIFSIDLSKYDSDLSQSFKSSLENNVEIFNKLSEKIEQEWNQRH